MLTLSEFAKKHKVGRSWVHQLLQAKRIPGARMIGKKATKTGKRGLWLIPPDAKILPPNNY
jgi:transcriptional regulator with XRE-family HTH domain